MKKVMFNADGGGVAKTILAGYYKYGCATILGENYGTSGTAVMEIYDDEEDSAEHR